MKVGFDISQLAFPGGVSSYLKNLALRLGKRKDLDMIYFYSSLRRNYAGSLKNVKSFRIPPTILEPLFNRLRVLPIEAFIGKVDVFHSSDWTQPPSRAKKVTTFHDVIPLKFPELSVPKNVNVHKRRLELVEREIDVVIAVSQSTKNDLIEISNISEEKIKVVYEAAGEEFVPQPDKKIEVFRKKFGLPKKFILAIGGIGNRRNLQRAKQAAGRYNLVITGETIPQVSDADMPLLYSAATVLLYPSLYEGFGLPILEAFGCGCPVVTSDCSGMSEVAGDAAILVDPKNLESIKEGIREAIAERERLREKGFVRAKNFSWEKCAAETVDVYNSIYQRSQILHG